MYFIFALLASLLVFNCNIAVITQAEEEGLVGDEIITDEQYGDYDGDGSSDYNGDESGDSTSNGDATIGDDDGGDSAGDNNAVNGDGLFGDDNSGDTASGDDGEGDLDDGDNDAASDDCTAEGFEWNGTACVDIDECSRDLHDCADVNDCINYPGGFACFSLTPIARYDVVPYQRILHAEPFKFGVVAFSKEGIDRVEVTITGQGYTGSTPLISNTMSYNDRTGVYEYWVSIQACDFVTDGPIGISTTVYGNDGGTRILDGMSLVVDATGQLPALQVWVDSSSGDDTYNASKINNSASPFATIAGAINGIQQYTDAVKTHNRSDGATVFLTEGTYVIESGVDYTNTENEWLTITRDSSAQKENVIIQALPDDWPWKSTVQTKLVRFKEISIVATAAGVTQFHKYPEHLWLDECRVIGVGRYTTSSNPIFRQSFDYPSYYTDTYLYDVAFGMHRGTLARGVSMEQVGNDPFQNVAFIVNARVDDADPGSTYWHCDGYQAHDEAAQNRIIYGYYGTNLHYQGLFLSTSEGEVNTNNAFVNIFMEMREPGRLGDSNPGSEPILMNGYINGVWDHLLLWHNSFPYMNFALASYSGSLDLTNASFIGNVFYELRSYPGGDENPISEALPGNVQGNEFLYNHYIYSCVDTGGCGISTDDPPHVRSKSPDSSDTVTQSLGDAGIDLSDPMLTTFGYPIDGSTLINRLPTKRLPADAVGNMRDEQPDIGALEYRE